MAHRPALGAALDHTVWPWYWAAQHSSDLAVSGQPYSTRQTATSQSGPVSRAMLAFPAWETELTRWGKEGLWTDRTPAFTLPSPQPGRRGLSLGPPILLCVCLDLSTGPDHVPRESAKGEPPPHSRKMGLWKALTGILDTHSGLPEHRCPQCLTPGQPASPASPPSTHSQAPPAGPAAND